MTGAEHPATTSSVLADPLFALLERFGVGVAMLLVLLWAIKRGAEWIAPRIDRLVARHESLIDKIEQELGRHGKVLERMDRTQVAMGETQTQILSCVERIKSELADART